MFSLPIVEAPYLNPLTCLVTMLAIPIPMLTLVELPPRGPLNLCSLAMVQPNLGLNTLLLVNAQTYTTVISGDLMQI